MGVQTNCEVLTIVVTPLVLTVWSCVCMPTQFVGPVGPVGASVALVTFRRRAQPTSTPTPHGKASLKNSFASNFPVGLLVHVEQE